MGSRSEPIWFVLRREMLRRTQARSHPRLLASVALILYCILSRWIGTATAFLIAFDGGAVVFLAAVWIMMALATAEGMRRRAEIEDEGRYAVLGFSAAAAIAILLAIVFELHGIKDRPSALAVVLAAATILLSWLFMNTIFALHYAHGYYGDGDPSDEYKAIGGSGFSWPTRPRLLGFHVFLVCRRDDLPGLGRAGRSSHAEAGGARPRRAGFLLQRRDRRSDHQHRCRADLKNT
jgi:uncharacterized membrane protein